MTKMLDDPGSQLYTCPEEISAFIERNKVNVPALQYVLSLRREKRLELTNTEYWFYFQDIFDYIYDVFRDESAATNQQLVNWLEYIDMRLVFQGFNSFIPDAIKHSTEMWTVHRALDAMEEELHSGKEKLVRQVNYFTDVKTDSPDYYISKSGNLIESFWIHSSHNAGQPERAPEENEAYMRVHVFPDHVYIFGCDDCSYTLQTKSALEAKEFAQYLKEASPVWHFSYIELIHPKLKFTN